MDSYLAEIKFYDSDNEEELTEYIGLNADNFTNAMHKIENYYGDDLISVSIKYKNGNGMFIFPDEATYQQFLNQIDY